VCAVFTKSGIFFFPSWRLPEPQNIESGAISFVLTHQPGYHWKRLKYIKTRI